MPAEHVPQVDFVQVMLIHLLPSCSMTFSMFSSEISVHWRGIGRDIFKWNIFHAHVVCQLNNEFPSVQYIVSRLLKLLLLHAVFIGFPWHKCSERTMWLQKYQLLVHCQWNVSPIFSLIHGCWCLENNTYCCESVCSWPRKLKYPYFRIAVNLICDMFSENIRILQVSLQRKWSRWFLPCSPLTCCSGEQQTTLAHICSSQSHSLLLGKLLRWYIWQLNEELLLAWSASVHCKYCRIYILEFV